MANRPGTTAATVIPTFKACVVAALLCLGVTVAVPAKPLDLANRPLFTGSNVKPNIMVAVDDSGSMDFETLFPTNSGLLYWDQDNHTTWTDADGGRFVNNRDIAYAYLFPNGYNNCDYYGCDAKDRRIYSNYYAVPPIPAMAFARSPQYNSAYFNPSIKYTPWVTQAFGDVDPSSAPADPSVGDSRFDLTQIIKRYRNGYKFAVLDDTPFGGTIYNDGNPECIKYEYEYKKHKKKRRCVQYRYWKTWPADADYNDDRLLGIQYFPATFYLKAGESLPSDFGWKSGSEEEIGYTPDGQKTLVRYEIKPDNFVSQAKYQAAIQNFANWFTYYRKRHLAVRGGIAGAFDQISQVRVGQCTINRRDTLQMRDLDGPTDRSAFYSSIFNIDFSRGQGTPNRKGLQFLGEQLKDNANIITSPCQQNFAILFTDGYNTGTASRYVGNTDKPYGPPFADNDKNTMADVAMKYYKDLGDIANPDIARDQLRLPEDCEGDAPPLALDCEKDLHMVTFGVTLDQHGIIFNNQNEYPDENDDPYANPPDWPDPNPGYYGSYGIEQIDDLWHASVNTRGKLLNAKTPEKVASAFSEALQKIINFKGSATSIAANSSTLSTDSAAYGAGFSSGIWTGTLKAYAMQEQGIDTETPLWSASRQLAGQDPSSRVVLTTLDTGIDSAPSIFDYASLQSASSLTNPLSQAQVQYLRGDRSNEQANGGDFRNRRTNILGDIVHSTPAYVGPPTRYRYPKAWKDLLYPDQAMPETAYRLFADQYQDRDPVLYLGANDGMLHGFDAESGTEKLAYVPYSVIPDLAELTQSSYAHRYYVDASPTSGDVFYAGAWHTVLVGGLGNGGRGIYALDITDPSRFSEANPGASVLWEYTDNENSELGQTFGQPSIVRLHNGRWAAMFANGYNSDSEGASLFLVDIQTGALIKRIATGATPAASNAELANGLATPFPVDLDGDFVTDYAYAGDLYGNMWRFDLSADTAQQWSASRLFHATYADGTPQPITARPQVGIHSYGRQYGVMVYFGTGKYLENDDAELDTTVQNSFYGIWDLNVFSFLNANNGEPLFETDLKDNIPDSRLINQKIVQQTRVGDKDYRVVSDNSIDYQRTSDDTDGDRGWRLDLPSGAGDQVVTNPRIQGKTVSFSTRIAPQQSCSPGGSGFFMTVDAVTGGRTGFSVFDLNGDKQFNEQDKTSVDEQLASVSGVATNGAPSAANYTMNRGEESAGILDRVTISSSNASVTQFNVNIGRRQEGRRSWQQIRRRAAP